MIKVKKLESGVTLVCEKMPEHQAAAIGIWVGAGSSYETPEISGISHFIEHMFFKGTANRSYKAIAEDMDKYGAQFNAFTGKEYTCFHAKALTQVFPSVCEVLFDMMSNSLFDEKEMNKERGVILEEMRMVEDTPDDYIIDVLTENVMKGTDVSNSIIGTRKSLKNIHREDIIKYINNHYTKDNIVVAVSGNYDEKILKSQINQYMCKFKATKNVDRSFSVNLKPSYSNLKKDINQTHIAFGLPTLSLDSKDYYAQSIVNDVLGGSMSSRLFQNIREEQGLAYTVFSCPQAYSKCGMYFIYAGVSLGKEADAVKGIAHELEVLGEKGLTEEEIQIVKQRMKAAYVFGLEKLDNRMLRLGKNRLLLGRNYTEAQTMKEIDSITKKQVNRFCEQIADINKYSAVSISKNKLDIKKLIKG